jgi:hypothetical protein
VKASFQLGRSAVQAATVRLDRAPQPVEPFLPVGIIQNDFLPPIPARLHMIARPANSIRKGLAMPASYLPGAKWQALFTIQDLTPSFPFCAASASISSSLKRTLAMNGIWPSSQWP